jgi:hypothetical protein
MTPNTRFTDHDITAFAPAEKIALLASVNPEGLPHITLITSMRAAGPSVLTLGEFCKGYGKTHIRQNPNTGFLIMTMDRRLWRGHARWTYSRQEGPEYESYNDLPMFRYNAYFGINTVHYLDLIDVAGPEPLPLGRILTGSLLTRLLRGSAATGEARQVLKPLGYSIFKRMDTLKFIAWITPDGWPTLVPVIQCQAADSNRLVFYREPCGSDLSTIPNGTPVAVYGLTMSMESVLARGRLGRDSRYSLGVIDMNWVYNSMPPCHGQIYPEVPLEPVTEFEHTVHGV